MTGIIDSALGILRASDTRLTTAANNVSNLATPGFKRQVSFSQAVDDATSAAQTTSQFVERRTDFSQGRMIETGNPLDLAIAGEGFFQLRDGERIVHSRHGQFRRADDGTVVTEQGYVLQQQGGGDLVIESGAVEIQRDGTVLGGGVPVGRIALSAAPPGTTAPAGGSIFAGEFGEDVETPDIRQGSLEASNVALSDEMTAMMAALRQAETGARLITTYDELLGRAISAFGQSGR